MLRPGESTSGRMCSSRAAAACSELTGSGGRTVRRLYRLRGDPRKAFGASASTPTTRRSNFVGVDADAPINATRADADPSASLAQNEHAVALLDAAEPLQ